MTTKNPGTAIRFLLVSCTLAFAAKSAQAGEEVQVFLSEGELNYVGYLEGKAIQRLFALYDALDVKPRTLAIRSRGGDVTHGLELGEWVHAHQLNVKVTEFCLSSCANYVFTAGSRKIVSSHAMVGFHGGLSSNDFSIGGDGAALYERMTASEKAAFQLALKEAQLPQLVRETAFFKKIAVRQELTTYGQQKRFEGIPADGWTFTQDGFRFFGVDRIEVINPPWIPRLLTFDAKIATLAPR